jgi:hypothetical protein
LTFFPKLIRFSPVSFYNLVAEFICKRIMVDALWGRLGRSIHGWIGYPFTGGDVRGEGQGYIILGRLGQTIHGGYPYTGGDVR